MNDQELLTYAAKAAGYSNPTWNDAGTKPDHPCLCRTRVHKTDWPEYYNYWNGNFWGLTTATKENAIDNKDLPTPETNIQWREVQP